MSKPIIGVTMGDPAGVGPEIVVKSLVKDEVKECVEYLKNILYI